MSRRPPTQRFRLRPEHLDLVRAALAPRSAAAAAYRRWRATVRLEDTDAGSYRLIPLVHHNLAAHPLVTDADAHRFAQMTRFTWVKSNLIMHRAELARAALARAGIPSIAVKGLAVLHHAALPVGLRPMDDADLAVRVTDAVSALATLHAAGFTSDEVDLDDAARLGSLIAAHHGLNLSDASGVQVDLHWHTIPHALHPAADDAMWARAGDRTAAPEDTLVQVLAHATRWSRAPSVQWMADAVLLIRAGVDWSIVVDEVTALRIGIPVADALEVIEATGLVALPTGVLGRLRRAPVAQRVEGRLRTTRAGAWRSSSAIELLADGFGDHVRRTVPPGGRAGLAPVGSFLVERWALERMRHLPRHARWIVGRRRGTMPAAGRPPVLPGIDHFAENTMRFSVGETGVAWLGRGWSFPENHGSWTIGTEAVVEVPLGDDAERIASPLRLHFGVVPFLCDNVRSRRIDVFIDGRWVDRWDFTGSGWSPTVRTVNVPPDLASTGTRSVRFVIDRPVSPQSADHDVGTRQLGLSLGSIVLDSGDPGRPDSPGGDASLTRG